MLIQKKRVRQLSLYLGGLIPRSRFVLATQSSNVNSTKLDSAGFGGLSIGDVLLPGIVGPVSRYNAEGKYQILRHLPKESRFMGRREWTREEWAGPGETRTVTEAVDNYRDCYPRSFIPPPAIELTVVDSPDGQLIASSVYTWEVTPSEQILHAINLLLEIFGETEVRHENLASFFPPNTRRVNWSMLPSGGGTSASVIGHVQPIISRQPPTVRGPILSRLTYLADLEPDEVYLGHGGFTGYVAYIFNQAGKAILESIMPENATYVFDGNWQNVVQLTKTQVLAGNLHQDRIFHNEGWLQRVTAHVR